MTQPSSDSCPQLRIEELSGRKKDLLRFVGFPFDLYRDDPLWIPPVISDEIKCLDPEINPAFDFSRGKYWLAMRDDRCVGRVAGFVNDRDNERRGLRNARFALIDFIDEAEVCQSLLETAEAWARAEGMTKIEGPLGLTTFDSCAVLIEGFEHLPTTVSTYNFPYYAQRIESCGYSKEVDYIEQKLPLPFPLDPKYERIAAHALKRKSLRVVAPKTKGELRPYIRDAFELVNECYSDLYEFVPFTPEQMAFLVNRYLPVIDPGIIKLIADSSGTIVGAGIALPSISRALQAARGKLFPLGWFRFLRAQRHNETLDLYLIAVKPELRRAGLSAIIVVEMVKYLATTKIRHLETNGILETNERVFSTWKEFGATTHKRRRIYSKVL